MKFMDLNYQLSSINEEIFPKLKEIISSSAFIGGQEISSFEKEFSNYINSEYCVGVGNGTDALEIAIEALDMPKGSEIIVPSNSFVASSEAVTRCGHKVLFSDICDEHLVISTKNIDEVITENTKAIICVHLYGNPCDLKELKDYCNSKNIYLIEDCAQAHGAYNNNDYFVGSSGDIAAWSFYPGKNLGAFGDAGAVTTNNDTLAQKSRAIANHGRLDKYNHFMEGRNSRMDNLQAAVLRIKLKHLDDWTDIRIKNASIYESELSNISGLKLQKTTNSSRHVYHLYVVRTEKREALKNYLANNGVQTSIHYPILLPQLEAYKYMHQDILPKLLSDNLANTLISLPIGEHLVEEDIMNVTKLIKDFYQIENS